MAIPKSFQSIEGKHVKVNKKDRHEASKDKKYKVHSLKKRKRERERKQRQENQYDPDGN